MTPKQVNDAKDSDEIHAHIANIEPSTPTSRSRIRHRFIVSFFLFLSNLICYADRTNMSVCIIPMAEQFGWSEMTQASVLSSFFWGYMSTQIPSGLLCKKFGGKRVLLTGVIVWSIFTLFTPVASKWASDWMAVLIAVRIGMGVGEGANFPSVYHLCGAWIPRNERTRLMTFINSGTDFGTCAAMLLGPVITLTIGWQYTFYAFGVMGILWCFVFHKFVTDRPEDDPHISQYEIDYIRDMNQEKQEDVIVEQPVNTNLIMMLLNAKCVWAIIIAQTCYNFGWYILLNYMPKILISLGIAFEKVGYFSVLSYLIVILISNASAQFADMMINRLDFTVEKTRKIMQSISFLGSSLFYMLMRYTKHSASLSILLLCLGIGCGSFCRAGYLGNHVDIAPRYAGLVFGISNTVATIPGIFGPLITGAILQRFPLAPWDIVFNIVVTMNIVGAAVWIAWAKGTTQFH